MADITTSAVQAPAADACPVSSVVEVLLSRWTTPILWTLHTSGRMRFQALTRQVPAVSPKVLTQRLRQLERDGLVTRTYHPGVPPRVEYEITPLGASLAEVFARMTEWGDQHMPLVEMARSRYDAGPGPGRGR